ncbi:MAG: ABC transporter ATP-binding protein/permease [Spirochaetaceae bacterium]|jgi:ATP-binding cassette subfamily B protein|nr:ABC transporter ATP-binding protein/permease [Spirochaetaceae bacterium]
MSGENRAATPPPRMGMRGGAVNKNFAKPKNFRASMKKLARYMTAYIPLIIAAAFFAAVSSVFTVIGPKFLGRATDTLISGAAAGAVDFAATGKTLLSLLLLYIVAFLFSYLQGFVMSSVTAAITRRLRGDIFKKMHSLPFSYFDETSHGDILSRITNDVDTISSTMNQSFSQIITSVASLAGIVVMMFTISWQLTLVTLFMIPASLFSASVVIKSSQVYFKKQQDFLGAVNGHIEEMFSAHDVVCAFNGQDGSIRKFDGLNDALYKSAWKANFLSGIIMPLTFIISNLVYVVVCIVGGSLALKKIITIGDIQAFLQYVRSFVQPLQMITNVTNILQQTAAAAERVFEFLGLPDEIPDAPDAKPLVKSEKDFDVCFENVVFGYKKDKIIIHDFSANAPCGQKIAIVGPTGAGKSTMVKLLMRFYDVSGGAIKINGGDIRFYKRDSLRSVFGMVLQDTWLFNGSIADNIRYGKPDASIDEVIAAAKAAQVDNFVRSLPDGYDMILNEEADNISRGQKQLLTIARTIIASPAILILDEATSNVDTHTEVLIQQAMDNLMSGRTSFVIAHRLSTIRNAALILVMKDGDIIEQGNHEELLAKGGFYANMYNSQFD